MKEVDSSPSFRSERLMSNGFARRAVRRPAAIIGLTGLCAGVLGIMAGQDIDKELSDSRYRLLQAYSDYKNYGIKDSQEVFDKKLKSDRQAVFDAIVRALL